MATETAPAIAATRFSHLGICVSDTQRALRFYVDGLGFTPGNAAPLATHQKALLGLSGTIDGGVQFVRLGEMMLELIEFREPATIPAPAGLRPFNLRGFTHLSFHVENIDEFAAHLENCGGHIVKESRFQWEHEGVRLGEMLFCTDPDGNRVELMTLSGAFSFTS